MSQPSALERITTKQQKYTKVYFPLENAALQAFPRAPLSAMSIQVSRFAAGDTNPQHPVDFW